MGRRALLPRDGRAAARRTRMAGDEAPLQRQINECNFILEIYY
jgi:hypothetical protein